tara:strand:- start:501 stop:2156 length:1656 start_codon:yes stop_codon:yes gene_type:complete
MGLPALPSFEEPQGMDAGVKQAVLEQLERIRKDKLFRDTTRMKRFLSYVVQESLEGNSDLLKGYTIGVEVFDKPDDFDPQADTIVRVQAGQLRRRLDLYYGSSGLKDPVRIVIPKGQYAPVFEIRREVPESILAGTDENDSQPTETNQISHFVSRPGIAVFTFNNISGPEQSDYFAEGLTAEIINALVQFRYLRIVARMPTIEHSGGDVDLKKFGKEYDVQFVLNGTVRRLGDLFRVSVDLISTETGEHIFTRIFDKKYSAENIFETQEEIASYTAAKVAAPFGVINRFNRRENLGRRRNLSAYEALLKFYELKISPSTGKVRSLLKEFEEITETQENYSSAWAVRSLLNTFLCTLSLPSEVNKGRLEAAIECGTKSSAIDPDNALAFVALFQAHYHSGNLDIAERMAHKARALNPNDYSFLAYYALTSAFRGNSERAKHYHKAALRLVDRPPAWFYTSELCLAFRAKRFEAVLDALENVNTQSAVGSQIMWIACLGHLEDVGRATQFLQEAHTMFKDYDRLLAEVFLTWQPDDELRELVFKGWQRAGLDI